MSPAGHVVTSIAAGAAVAAVTGSRAAGLACVLAGIFIDLDHFVEYFWYEGLKLDLQDFRIACEETRFPKTILILHSYELLAAAWALSLWVLPSVVLRGTLVGLTLHMLCDQVFNEPFPGCYFLLYRASVRFDAARIFKPAARRRMAPGAAAREGAPAA